MADPSRSNTLLDARLDASAILRALKHRDYRLFIAGQLISVIGTWMQNVAQSWLVYRLTGSALLLGTVNFVAQIPMLPLTPFGGAVADRFPRKLVIIIAQVVMMIQAFVLAFLVLTGRAEIWHVMLLAAVLGSASAFEIPARQSFLVQMVGKEDLMNAIALNSSVFNSARMIGPAVAGVLVATIGEGWCFFLNGCSYLAVLIALFAIRGHPRPQRVGQSSPLADIFEGFRFVLRNPPVHALLALLGCVSLFALPFTVLMPVFADRILGAGAQGLGVLTSSFGVGSLLGALMIAARRGVRGLGRWIAMASTGFALSLMLFSLSRSFFLSTALLVPCGFAVMVQLASTNTLIQNMVPDELRGRVIAIYSMVLLGFAPFGSLLAGSATDRFGAPLTTAMGGAICVAAAAAFWWRWPAMRVSARELIVAQQLPVVEPAERA